MEFLRELDAALKVAHEANLLLSRYAMGAAKVSYKGINDPVTEADTALNALILQSLQNSFPDDGYLCEETTDNRDRFRSRRLWCIDPLDGTKEFISGTGEYAIMIGFAVDEKAVMGVVQQPVPGITYWGTQSEAWMQAGKDEPVRLSVGSVKNLSEAAIVVSRSHSVPLIENFIHKAGIRRVIRSGSVGVKCGLVASRRSDLYIHPGPGTKEWDTCAPEAILRGAGGEFTDTAGRRLRYNQPDIGRRNGILAANRELHSSSVALLEDIGKEAQ